MIFQEELVRSLGYRFGRGTLIPFASFRVILVTDAGAIADGSTAIEVLKRELKNANSYGRIAFSPNNPAWSAANSRAEFPQDAITVAVTAGTTTLNFDGIGVIGDTQTAANGTVSAISSDTITLNGHGRANGDLLFFTSTDTYPTGLPADTIRYVVNSTTNQFQVATTVGGSAIALGNSWGGTLTAHYLGNTKLIGLKELPEAVTLNPGQSRTFTLNFTSDN